MILNHEKEETLISAGGVVYRTNPGEIEICLIAKQEMRIWALPRGRVEFGETPEEAAIREVREETGFIASVQGKLDEITFRFFSNIDDRFIYRIIHIFLMRWESGEPGPLDQEIDLVKWFPLSEAIRTLKYENEKEVLRKAKRLLKKQEVSSGR